MTRFYDGGELLNNSPERRKSSIEAYKPRKVRKLLRAPQVSIKVALVLSVFCLSISFNIPADYILIIVFGTSLLPLAADELFKKNKFKILSAINPYSQKTPKALFKVYSFWNTLNYLILILFLMKTWNTYGAHPEAFILLLIPVLPIVILSINLIINHFRWSWLWKAMELRMAGMGLRPTNDLPLKKLRLGD